MPRRRRTSPKISLFAFQDIITSVTGIMVLITLLLALELLQRKEESPPVKTAEITEQIESSVEENRQQIEDLKQQLKQQGQQAVELARVDPTHLSRQITDTTRLTEAMQQELEELEQQQDATANRQQQAEQDLDQREESKSLEQLLQEIAEHREKIEKITQSNRMIFNPDAGENKTPWLVEVQGNQIQTAPVGQAQRPEVFADVGEFRRWVSGRNPSREYFVLLVKPAGIDAFDDIRTFLQSKRFDVGYDVLAADQNAIDPETGTAP